MVSHAKTVTGRASYTKKPPAKPKKRLVNHRGGAPIGNKFYLQRSSHGRKPIFSDPEMLLNACIEYFDWVDAHPIYESQPFAYQGKVALKNVPKMRAMSITGLCLFLDIAIPTWRDYAQQQGFSAVTALVESTIRSQKMEGAAAGQLNPTIIARDLGLSEKTEISGPNGGSVSVEAKSISKRDLAKAMAIILAKGLKAEPEK